MRRAIVADQDNMLWTADLSELPYSLFGCDNAVFGSAPLDIDTHEIGVGAECCFRIVDSSGRIPLRRILDGLEAGIVLLNLLHTTIRAVLAVQGGEVSL